MAALVAEWLTVGLTVLGAVFFLLRWISKVDQNTIATERLTAAFDSFSEKVGDRLLDHEKRIMSLEARSHK